MKRPEKMVSGKGEDLVHENVSPSKASSKECISPMEYIEAADQAGLPKAVRKIMPFTVEIYQVVSDLKTKRHLGKPAREHWSWLRCILNTAVETDDWSAFDDLAQAWRLLKPNHRRLGQKPSKTGDFVVREPAKLAVINAVVYLQHELERLPYRNEILDYVNTLGERDMDNTELSRQLKSLRWAERIPYAPGAKRSPKKILEPAPLTAEKLASSNYFRKLAAESQPCSQNENTGMLSRDERGTVDLDSPPGGE